MSFKLKNGEQVRTVFVPIASATVIPAGALAGITAGLAVDAVAATPKVAYCEKGSADGEVLCELTVGTDFTLVGTADAVFAVTYRGTEVDITDTQTIDVGTSSTDVLLVDISEDAGVVGSAANVTVRINPTKALF